MAARRSSHARRGGGSPVPAWIWLLSGILIGIVLSAVAIFGGMAPGLRAPAAPEPAASTPAASGQGADEAAPARPRYEFYSVLPEQEVVIPDSELRERVRAETPSASTDPAQPAATTPTATGVRYRLQAGSYRDPRPAEEAKARLALLGVTASVQSVNINGATYHRVYVGPFDSAAEVERVKQQLADSGMQAIAVREQTQ